MFHITPDVSFETPYLREARAYFLIDLKKEGILKNFRMETEGPDSATKKLEEEEDYTQLIISHYVTFC